MLGTGCMYSRPTDISLNEYETILAIVFNENVITIHWHFQFTWRLGLLIKKKKLSNFPLCCRIYRCIDHVNILSVHATKRTETCNIAIWKIFELYNNGKHIKKKVKIEKLWCIYIGIINMIRWFFLMLLCFNIIKH